MAGQDSLVLTGAGKPLTIGSLTLSQQASLSWAIFREANSPRLRPRTLETVRIATDATFVLPSVVFDFAGLAIADFGSNRVVEGTLIHVLQVLKRRKRQMKLTALLPFENAVPTIRNLPQPFMVEDAKMTVNGGISFFFFFFFSSLRNYSNERNQT